MEQTSTLNNYTHTTLYNIDPFINNAGYIDPYHLFYHYFQSMPNVHIVPRINCKKAALWFEMDIEKQLQVRHYKQYHERGSEVFMRRNVFVLRGGIVVYLEVEFASILFITGQDVKAKELVETLKQFRKNRTATEIHLLVSELGSLHTTPMKVDKPKLSISTHYNDDLQQVHKKIIKLLRTKGKSGLLLFHGSAGTGKSTYIRYLIHQLNKKVIFLTPKLAEQLDQPDYLEFLVQNKDAVFVIEDAEELLLSRETSGASNLSMLLNLTDGILGSCLGIQVIATFNAPVVRIDPALMRKGRLLVRYEFKPLVFWKAQSLLNNLGVDETAVSEMTLADIYNTREQNESNSLRKSIGFKIK